MSAEPSDAFGPIEGWKIVGCAGCNGHVYVPDAHHPKDPAYCNVCEHERKAKMSKGKKAKKASTANANKAEGWDEAAAASAQVVEEAKGPAPEFTEIRRFKDRLKVAVSNEEHATLSAEFARQYRLRETALEARRNDMAHPKEILTGIDQRMAELAESVEVHVKYEDVECVERLYGDNEVRIVRVDTGDVIETRVADPEDLQPELFDEGNAPREKTGVCPHCAIVDGHRPDCPGPEMPEEIDTEPPPPRMARTRETSRKSRRRWPE